MLHTHVRHGYQKVQKNYDSSFSFISWQYFAKSFILWHSKIILSKSFCLVNTLRRCHCRLKSFIRVQEQMSNFKFDILPAHIPLIGVITKLLPTWQLAKKKEYIFYIWFCALVKIVTSEFDSRPPTHHLPTPADFFDAGNDIEPEWDIYWSFHFAISIITGYVKSCMPSRGKRVSFDSLRDDIARMTRSVFEAV